MKRTEEQIVAEMEASLAKRKKKILLRISRKTNSYLKRLEAAKKALVALRGEPDWLQDPYSEKLLQIIEAEIDTVVQASNPTP